MMDNSDLAGVIFAAGAIAGVIAGGVAFAGAIVAAILICFL